MTTPRPLQRPRSRSRVRPLARTLVAIGLMLAFVVLTSYIRPSDTTAQPGAAIPPADTPPADTPATSVGWLHSADYLVEILLTEHGTRYDVYDAYGDPIMRRATREEMYHIDPVLDPDSMLGQTPMGLVTDDDPAF